MNEFIKNLIERLEERKNLFLDDTSDFGEGKYSAYGDSISIVKKLEQEYSNDVCEWKLDGVYIHCQHDTEIPISCLVEEKCRYKYCPYCGKEIKVIE